MTPGQKEARYAGGLCHRYFRLCVNTGSYWRSLLIWESTGTRFISRGRYFKCTMSLGLQIRHRNENFWNVWPQVLKPNTYYITNPPIGKGFKHFVVAFFEFLITFDHPFLLILPNRICGRKYYEVVFRRIRRPKDLYIWGLSKSFPMENDAEGRITGFTGLTIVANYKTEWNFVLDRSKFKHVFTKDIIHFP